VRTAHTPAALAFTFIVVCTNVTPMVVIAMHHVLRVLRIVRVVDRPLIIAVAMLVTMVPVITPVVTMRAVSVLTIHVVAVITVTVLTVHVSNRHLISANRGQAIGVHGVQVHVIHAHVHIHIHIVQTTRDVADVSKVDVIQPVVIIREVEIIQSHAVTKIDSTIVHSTDVRDISV
jgi:hypothetical protein